MTDQQTGEQTEWRSIGLHSYRFSRDIVIARFVGPISTAEIDQVVDGYFEVHKQYGHVLVLAFSSATVTFEPQARERAAARFREQPFQLAIADVGGGPVLRVMSTLAINAVRLLVNSMPLLGFFATEAEARAWLDAQRSTFQRSMKTGR